MEIKKMTCLHPIRIENKKWNSGHITPGTIKRFYEVPCRKCINCIANRNKELELLTDYDYTIKYKGVGSFITLTYNQVTIPLKDIDGKLYTNVTTKEIKDYINRLRNIISRMKEKDPRIRHDFEYIACTERGEKNGRGHIHIILLGIDNIGGKKVIEQAWNTYQEDPNGNRIKAPRGRIDILPIKDGGINYVIKYQNKTSYQTNKKLVEMGLQPAKIVHSQGLGGQLIKDKWEEIKANNGKVKWKNKEYLIPKYYRDKLNIRPNISIRDRIRRIESQGYKYINIRQLESVERLLAMNIAKNRQIKLEQDGAEHETWQYWSSEIVPSNNEIRKYGVDEKNKNDIIKVSWATNEE